MAGLPFLMPEAARRAAPHGCGESSHATATLKIASAENCSISFPMKFYLPHPWGRPAISAFAPSVALEGGDFCEAKTKKSGAVSFGYFSLLIASLRLALRVASRLKIAPSNFLVTQQFAGSKLPQRSCPKGEGLDGLHERKVTRPGGRNKG